MSIGFQIKRKNLSELLVKIMIWTLNYILIFLSTNHFAKNIQPIINVFELLYTMLVNYLVTPTVPVYVVYSSSFRLLMKISVQTSPELRR